MTMHPLNRLRCWLARKLFARPMRVHHDARLDEHVNARCVALPETTVSNQIVELDPDALEYMRQAMERKLEDAMINGVSASMVSEMLRAMCEDRPPYQRTIMFPRIEPRIEFPEDEYDALRYWRYGLYSYRDLDDHWTTPTA